MASETSVQQYYANHRWFVIGGIGALVAALVGIVQLRKATPAIQVNLPAGTGATAGFGTTDILGAYGAGSSATLAGAAGSLGLGQGGLDLAAQALQSEAGSLQVLGTTQAGMGGTLAQILQELIDKGYPQPVASPPPVAVGQPIVPTPQPTSKTVTLWGGLTYLIPLNWTRGMNLIVPQSNTYAYSRTATITDPDPKYGGAQALAYVVSQGGQDYYLLARNTA